MSALPVTVRLTHAFADRVRRCGDGCTGAGQSVDSWIMRRIVGASRGRKLCAEECHRCNLLKHLSKKCARDWSLRCSVAPVDTGVFESIEPIPEGSRMWTGARRQRGCQKFIVVFVVLGGSMGSAESANHVDSVASGGATFSDGGSRPPFTATIINGSLSSFPSVVSISAGRGSCSATLVSTRAIVTASHCVRANGSAVQIKLDSGRTVRAVCEKSPASLENPPGANGSMSFAAIRSDVAACKIDEEVTGVDTACVGQPLSPNREALLVGFGIANNGPQPIDDGRQRQGRVRIVARRGGLVQSAFVDIEGNEASALGPGDSGGFAGTRNDDGKLFISAINSAGNATGRDGRRITIRKRGSSVFTDLMSQLSQDFLADFSRRNGVSLCGVAAAAGEATPPVSPPAGNQPPPGSNTPPQPNPVTPPPAAIVSNGALVSRTVPGGFAESRLGLRPGDTLELVGSRNVRTASDAVGGLRSFLNGNGTDLRLRIRRADGSRREMTLRFPPANSAQARAARARFQLGVLLRA